MKIIILGSGPKEKIPREGHKDEVCMLARKLGSKERRLQSSILLSTKNDNILFDCTEDIEEQAKHFNPKTITAIVITHAHSDAIGGLYKFSKMVEKRLPLYASKEVIEKINERFKELNYSFNEIENAKHYLIGKEKNITITPFLVEHSLQSEFPTFGFVIEHNGKKITYNEDVKVPADDKYYKDKDLLIVDGAIWGLEEPNIAKDLPNTAGHLIVNDDYLKWLVNLNTPYIIITQIGHSWPPYKKATKILKEHLEKIEAKKKPKIFIAYDGMEIKFNGHPIIKTLKNEKEEDLPKPKWVKYLTAPHAKLIWLGEKKYIVSSIRFKRHINEPLYFADAKYVYGIIEMGEPKEVNLEKFRELENEHKVSEAERNQWWPDAEVLYLYKVKILKRFKKPIPYVRPQGFQNFIRAEKIFSKQISFGDWAAFYELFPEDIQKMKISEITPENLRKASRKEILILNLRIHQLWNNPERKKRNSPSDETLLNAYYFLTIEMDRRGIKYNKDTELYRKMKEFIQSSAFMKSLMENIKSRLEKLNDIVLVENYLNWVGSSANEDLEDHKPRDIDILVRNTIKDPNLELKFSKVIGEKIHWIYHPAGPHSNYFPIADLVLRIKKPLKRVEISESRYEKSLNLPKLSYYLSMDIWKYDSIIDAAEALKHLNPGQKILEIGCGTGRFLKALIDSGFEAEGVDNDDYAIAFCKNKNLKVTKMDGLNLNYDDNTFDVVISLHTAEHAPDFKKFLSESLRVAKSYVIHIVPLGKRADPSHYYVFKTIENVRKLCPEGTELIEIKPTNCCLIKINKTESAIKFLKKLEPFKKFDPPKPLMAAYTEFFRIDELWDRWAQKWIEKGEKIDVEEKLNGFRAICEKRGNKVRISFEKKDRTKVLSQIAEQLLKIPDDFILDCDIGIERDEKRLPRIKIMTLLADEPQLEEKDIIKVTVFDLPFWKEDLSEKPLYERRKKLEEFFNKYLKKSKNFALTSFNVIDSKSELEKVAQKLASIYMSEGIVAKVLSSPYPEGGTNFWSKVKKVLEIKVIVLEKQVNKNDTFSYYCGLRIGDFKVPEDKIVGIGDNQYYNLGKTMSTNINAKKGDILTIQVEEIIYEAEGNNLIKLQWVIPRVIDIDRERTQPYFIGQVIDLASRFKVLQKSLKEEGEPTQKDIALEFWENNWWKMYPKKGGGKFIMQHHWRGLSEEEAKELSEKELMQTDHNVHADLRFQTTDEMLWGFSVFEGDTEDLRKLPNFSKLIDKPKDIRGQPKLAMPSVWLRVGVSKPFISPPGEVGSTAKKWSKFFAIDKGTYEAGVWNRHFIEIFLNGKKLKGRYIIAAFPTKSGERVWYIEKPEDQKPYAETHKLEDVVKELKKKGHKYLIWKKPGEKAQFIDLTEV